MSMKATLLRAVDSAFRAIGDLVSPATLTSTRDSVYDWSTGRLVSTSTSITIDCVVTSKTKSPESDNQPLYDIVVKNYSQDLSLYDTLTSGGVTYKIESLEQYENVALLKARRVS